MLKRDSKNSYIIACDVCEMTTGIPGRDHGEAWSSAKKFGWTVRKDDPDVVHVCCGCGHSEVKDGKPD